MCHDGCLFLLQASKPSSSVSHCAMKVDLPEKFTLFQFCKRLGRHLSSHIGLIRRFLASVTFKRLMRQPVYGLNYRQEVILMGPNRLTNRLNAGATINMTK